MEEPRDDYWAQAMGKEINHQHPRVGFVFGDTLLETLDALRKAVLDS